MKFAALSLLSALAIALLCARARCSCALSTSGMDREARMTRMRENARYYDPMDGRKFKDWDRRYEMRFQGRVVSDLGCEQCPWDCNRVDLRAVAPDEFKRRYRDAIREEAFSRSHEREYLGFREHRRLRCVAEIHWSSLGSAMRELTDPGEARAVRYNAAYDVDLAQNDPDFAQDALRALAQEDDDIYGQLARDLLDEGQRE